MDPEVVEILTNISEVTIEILKDEENISNNESDIISVDSSKLRDVLELRLNCIQSWFLRCSSKLKLKCLNQMLEKLKDNSYLNVILTTLNYRLDKLRIYSESLPNTNYIYDKHLHDHNRSLEKNFLDETVNSDLLWFETLKVEQQMDVLINLLKLGGGVLINKFYNSAVKLKEERNQKTLRMGRDEPLIVDNSGTFLKGPGSDYLALEVEKKKQIWDDAISKYENLITLGITGTGKLIKKNSSGPGGKSADKVSKSSKGSKKSGASAKSKEMKGNNVFVLDQIQMLPVWIVKKIFGYLDQKTLKNMEHVNSYWAFVIEDMAKEKSCRKYMDKIIKKMEKHIQFLDPIDDQMISQPPPKTSRTAIRMKKLAERGAIYPKLLSTNTSKTKETTLLENAVHKDSSKFNFPTDVYENFPRNVPVNLNLLETPTYVVNELGKRSFKQSKNMIQGGAKRDSKSLSPTGSERS